MKITTVHEIKLSDEESIVSATFSSAKELVVLLSSGDVMRHSIDTGKVERLFSVTSNYIGGFDITAKSSIYTLDEIIVVVNDFKTGGFIHYPNKYKALFFEREDYHAKLSCYPIVLFKNEAGIPHLIYAQAWNHLQIMNLVTRQILTAAKSLIEEGAEEQHIEFYKTHEEHNKLTWPSPYDYFFGELMLSPDHKRFLSAGWIWGSYDAYTVYDIEHFITSNRIRDISIGGWQHSNRAVCWIDDETVVVAYNPSEEDEEDAAKDSPHELHFYRVNANDSFIERKIKVSNLNLVTAKMQFSRSLDALVIFSDLIGFVIVSRNGEIQFQDKNRRVNAYFSALNFLVRVQDKTIFVDEFKDALG